MQIVVCLFLCIFFVVKQPCSKNGFCVCKKLKKIKQQTKQKTYKKTYKMRQYMLFGWIYTPYRESRSANYVGGMDDFLGFFNTTDEMCEYIHTTTTAQPNTCATYQSMDLETGKIYELNWEKKFVEREKEYVEMPELDYVCK